jgi:gluconokinase
MSNTVPVSPYETCHGLVYFPRMIDKIRLHASGELGADYVPNLGKGFDVRCCSLLGVDYNELANAVSSSKTDEQAWEWVLQNGKALTEEQIEVWNTFMQKRGWNDPASSGLLLQKADAGLSHRDEIQTFFALFDAEEGRA